MTDQEIKKEIAEFLGFTDLHISPGSGQLYGREKPNHRVRTTLPNYPEDLNACHDFEKLILKNEPVMGRNTYGYVLKDVAGKHYYHATARQRCEALLRTIGKWKG